MNKLLAVCAATSLISFSAHVYAETDNTSPQLYIGASIGNAKNTYMKELSKLNNFSAFNKEDTDTAFKIFIGVPTNSPYLDLRASFVHLGNYEGSFQLNDKAASVELSLNGIYLDALPKYPLFNNKAAVFVSAGIGYTIKDEKVKGSVFSYDLQDTGVGVTFKYGAGVSFDINANLGVMAEIENYHIAVEDHNQDIDLSLMKTSIASAGVYYRF